MNPIEAFGMKLELLVKPHASHLTIGRNFPPEAVAEFDSTPKNIGDVVDVVGDVFLGSHRHFYYTFYFEMPVDMLLEIMCYGELIVSRDFKDNDNDSGILSGSLDKLFMASRIFCNKQVDRKFRGFFNAVLSLLEQDGVDLPFTKVDLGDQTYAVK